MDAQDPAAVVAAASLKQDLRRRLTSAAAVNRQASLEKSQERMRKLMPPLALAVKSSYLLRSGSEEEVNLLEISSALKACGKLLDEVETAVGPQSDLGPEGTSACM